MKDLQKSMSSVLLDVVGGGKGSETAWVKFGAWAGADAEVTVFAMERRWLSFQNGGNYSHLTESVRCESFPLFEKVSVLFLVVGFLLACSWFVLGLSLVCYWFVRGLFLVSCLLLTDCLLISSWFLGLLVS